MKYVLVNYKSYTDTVVPDEGLKEMGFEPYLDFFSTLIPFVSNLLLVLLLLVIIEVGYIIWRRMKKKSIKRQRWVLLFTFLFFVLIVVLQWLLSFGHGDPIF